MDDEGINLLFQLLHAGCFRVVAPLNPEKTFFNFTGEFESEPLPSAPRGRPNRSSISVFVSRESFHHHHRLFFGCEKFSDFTAAPRVDVERGEIRKCGEKQNF